jgi:aromatic-amino-acid transaminase
MIMSFPDMPKPSLDALLLLMQQYRADTRPDKLDLGIGVFRDAAGRTPVMASVKAAERLLVDRQTSKAYIGSAGDSQFVGQNREMIFAGAVPEHRLGGLQTPGGSGALRLAAEILVAGGIRRILITNPCWPNHIAIARRAGLEVIECPHLNPETGRFAIDEFLAALGDLGANDAVLLQTSCHNPTGQDPEAEDWSTIAYALERQGVVPLLDIAYQGLGDGLDRDAMAVRILAERLPYAFIASSCSKNFGLYRERVGCLHILAPDADQLALLVESGLTAARANWSMPPDHGAAVVNIILDDTDLRQDWLRELGEVRSRLAKGRQALARQRGAIDYSGIAEGRGMFCTLPLSAAITQMLRIDYAIYLAPGARVNLAGIDASSAAHLARAIEECLLHSESLAT